MVSSIPSWEILYIYCQLCVHPISRRYSISWQSDTTHVTLFFTAGTASSNFEVSLPMSNALTYLGFIQEMTTLREFKSAWHAVYQRLSEKDSHAPNDFLMYFIPLFHNQDIATLYMMLCDSDGSSVTMDDILSKLRWGGNGQYL